MRSTTAAAAGWSEGTSATTCSGQIEVRASPAAVIEPANVSGTATSTVPDSHTICDSAWAASTSGGIGGVHAATNRAAKGTRTMPRARIDIRGIVLILTQLGRI
ncbi:unannotated protein [freshwater metagenome]|uniref:Unannotated protein n=1 Tax=freshwater metagenome TaxID=449393 RepID=A0A6J7P6R1_9ZZZZ